MLKKLLVLLVAIHGASCMFSQKTLYSPTNLKTLEKSLILVSARTFMTGNCEETSSKEYVQGNPCLIVRVDSFYISKYEVSNFQYLEFLRESQKDTVLYKTLLPDTLAWRVKGAYNEPYVEYYLRHPAYMNYPVVGISHRQALAYCAWLTNNYKAEPDRRFKNAVFILPSKDQWHAAALGEPDMDFLLFPWPGYQLQDKKGNWLANFKLCDQAFIGRDSLYVKSNDGNYEKQSFYVASGGINTATLSKYAPSDVTAPVNSYSQNKAGLCNMAGNVEELLMEYGITKGGSWNDPGYYLQNQSVEFYDAEHETSAERGFRFIMIVKK
jgi:formylglycine-generating enzyme required for sulfatase activity